jgi:RND family efflux transporter MFP subunit
MNRQLKILLPVAVLGVGVGIYYLLNANKPEPEKREEAARPVTVFVETVKASPVQLNITTQGEVRSRVSIDLVSQVGGRIASVSQEFTEGGAVEPGQTLITIEDTDYQLALRQTEARVAAAKVNVELALADADVARKQLRGTSNPSDLALKKPQVAEARANLKAAEADLAQAQINLERTRVSLPFVGRMESTYVDFGQYVAPGTPLGRAFATDKVEVRLPLNNSQLASLGLPIGYTALPGEELSVEFSARVAGEEHHWEGRLLRLDASVDSDTRLIYAMAEVDDPYGANMSSNGMPLAVGLYVNAIIYGRKLEGAMRVSNLAMRAGERVYLVGEDGLLQIRQVEVSHMATNFAIIKSGLSIGDQVIISTIRNPIPGMAVQASSASNLVSNNNSDNGKG